MAALVIESASAKNAASENITCDISKREILKESPLNGDVYGAKWRKVNSKRHRMRDVMAAISGLHGLNQEARKLEIAKRQKEVEESNKGRAVARYFYNKHKKFLKQRSKTIILFVYQILFVV